MFIGAISRDLLPFQKAKNFFAPMLFQKNGPV